MSNLILLTVILFCQLSLLAFRKNIKKVSPKELTTEFWLNDARRSLLKAKSKEINIKKANNVILFIGDGMGLSTIAGARIVKNQNMYKSKEPDKSLFMEGLQNTGLIKTHCADDYVTDSSSSASAMLSSVKINSMMVNISPRVKLSDCENYDPANDDLEIISDMFHKSGRSVGIVTNTRITHATPSAVYSHSLNRYWESNVPHNCQGIEDIASQLIRKSSNYKVVLGGGKREFLPKNLNGMRNDSRNLLNEWENNMKNKSAKMIFSRKELEQVKSEKDLDYLFGLFNNNHLNYNMERGDEPSLKEMTSAAIEMLSRNKKGYFLMVEGGRIDHAHHASKAIKALDETLSFDEAIKNAYDIINREDTLIMVTADHSHVFTVGSYAHRDEDITGMNQAYNGQELDGKGHTSLLYSNGPGFKDNRENITANTNITSDYVYSSGVPFEEETHGGEDVAIYAEGPWSHLINGVHHQNYIGQLIMFASCIETPNHENSHCDKMSSSAYKTNILLDKKLMVILWILLMKMYFYL